MQYYFNSLPVIRDVYISITERYLKCFHAYWTGTFQPCEAKTVFHVTKCESSLISGSNGGLSGQTWSAVQGPSNKNRLFSLG